MMFGLKDTLKKGKDLALSQGLRIALDKVLEPYGRSTDFRLDSKHRNIELTVQLHGEVQPLQVMVRGYRIIVEGDRYFVEAGEIVTSREWLNTALEKYGFGRRVEIPARYARVAEQLI